MSFAERIKDARGRLIDQVGSTRDRLGIKNRGLLVKSNPGDPRQFVIIDRVRGRVQSMRFGRPEPTARNAGGSALDAGRSISEGVLPASIDPSEPAIGAGRSRGGVDTIALF